MAAVSSSARDPGGGHVSEPLAPTLALADQAGVPGLQRRGGRVRHVLLRQVLPGGRGCEEGCRLAVLCRRQPTPRYEARVGHVPVRLQLQAELLAQLWALAEVVPLGSSSTCSAHWPGLGPCPDPCVLTTNPRPQGCGPPCIPPSPLPFPPPSLAAPVLCSRKDLRRPVNVSWHWGAPTHPRSACPR